MRLTLILPKYNVRLDDPCCFPLGFMYISSVLKRQGHKVKILNFNLWDYDVASEVAGSDAVLFTGFEAFLPEIITYSAICRAQGIRTILGGALATFRPYEMLQYVDSVVQGEGEIGIFRALAGEHAVQGETPEIDSLPYPDYDGFGVAEYHRRNGIRSIGILTQRGCPFSCTFCSHTCKWRFRSLDAVFTELEHYRSVYNPELIVFNDNTLNLNKRRFLALCKGMTLPWCAAIRLDLMDEEMVMAAKKSGAVAFVVGVESFRQWKLDALNKRCTVESIKRGLELLDKHRIPYHGNLLYGLPGETLREFEEEFREAPPTVFPCVIHRYIGSAVEVQPNLEAVNAVFREYTQQNGKDYNA